MLKRKNSKIIETSWTQTQILQNKMHVVECIRGLDFLNHVGDPNLIDDYKAKKVSIPRHKGKLLIFDLDETLVHCVPDEMLVFDEAGICVSDTDTKMVMHTEDGEEDLYVNIRPQIKKTIMELKKLYQIVLFTASTSDYADAIINHFDPNHELFEARFYRQNCLSIYDEAFIKDLRIFEDNWNLKDIVLIDNSAHSFGPHINNGYPIVSYYDDREDRELEALTAFLKELYYEEDVRPVLRDTFAMDELKNEDI